MSRPINRTNFFIDGEERIKSEEREANWAEHIRREEQQQKKRHRSELERKKLRMLNRKWWQFWI